MVKLFNGIFLYVSFDQGWTKFRFRFRHDEISCVFPFRFRFRQNFGDFTKRNEKILRKTQESFINIFLAFFD